MNLDLAYLAGFFDGDGAVMLRPVTKKPGSYLLTAQVGSCCEASCRMFLEFGGYVRRCKHSYVKKDGSPTVYFEWRATQKKAEAALRVLGPYLRVRAEHAEIGLSCRARKSFKGSPVPLAEAAVRSELSGRMAVLNARGAAVSLRRLGLGIVLSAEEELAYLAGLFDAEGTISWVHDRKRVAPLLHIGVSNVADSPCLRFALRFGGTVNEVHRAGRGIFSWYRRQRKAVAVLQALVPYLREKRHAAEVALAQGIRPAARVIPLRREEEA